MQEERYLNRRVIKGRPLMSRTGQKMERGGATSSPCSVYSDRSCVEIECAGLFRSTNSFQESSDHKTDGWDCTRRSSCFIPACFLHACTIYLLTLIYSPFTFQHLPNSLLSMPRPVSWLKKDRLKS